MKINEIYINKDNPRVIRDVKYNTLVKSLILFPEMLKLRPIVIDDNNVVLGGNMRKLCIDYILEMDKQEIESIINNSIKTSKEKKELVKFWGARKKDLEFDIIKATDLKDEQKKEFIIKDNLLYGDWDYDKLANEYETELLNDWGFDNIDVADTEMEPNESIYTDKVKIPIYEPSGEAPPIKELYDNSYYKELKKEIESADLESEIKEFLLMAATRHIVFNFRNIANYYADADMQIKELFERSGLVIIDYNKAVEYGFSVLLDDIFSQNADEYGDGD